MKIGSRFTCYYCGQKEPCTRDHFVPKSKGGNLIVYACQLCQRSKADMMPMDWVYYLRAHPLINLEHVVRVDTAVRSLWAKILDGDYSKHWRRNKKP